MTKIVFFLAAFANLWKNIKNLVRTHVTQGMAVVLRFAGQSQKKIRTLLLKRTAIIRLSLTKALFDIIVTGQETALPTCLLKSHVW